MPISPSNLKLYLSGGVLNVSPNASLGGARSNATVQPGLYNLFDIVRGDEARTGSIRYRCVYFRNEDPDPNGLMAPLRLWIAIGDTSPYTAMDIGFDPAGKDGTATLIADDMTAPTNVSFSRPMNKTVGLDLPSPPYLQDNAVAFWVRRTVQAGAIATALDSGTLRIEGDQSA